MSEQEEKALVPQTGGLGMGGLGDFTAESFEDSLVDTDGVKGSATGEDIRDAMGNVKPAIEVRSKRVGGQN